MASFGNCVSKLGLYRSDCGHLEISQANYSELFEATIGGCGLSGVITWAEITLTKIPSQFLSVENRRFSSLDDFFILSQQSNNWDYSVAWVDCLARGNSLGRGVFSRARFTEAKLKTREKRREPFLSIPKYFPSFVMNKHTIKLFNSIYFNKASSEKDTVEHFDKFFYPLDKIKTWNNLYGGSGFISFNVLFPNDLQKMPWRNCSI